MKMYIKIIVITLMTVSLLLCCRYDVFAAELLPNGKVLPDYPDVIYERDYVLMYRTSSGGDGELMLFLLPDDGIVKMSDLSDPYDTYNGSGGEVLKYSFPSGTVLHKYSYSSSAWSCAGSSNLSGTQAPYVYIVKSTVDIYYSGDTSIIYYASNADIIEKKIIFKFIKEPESTTDMIYNLLLMDSMAAVTYVGYRCMKRIFARIRTLRNWKGERKC